MTTLKGKVSWFGGPYDEGVSPDEGLAFIYDIDMAPDLFLPYQPQGTTGLARRLDPDGMYIACRWDYDQISKEDLLDTIVEVYAPKTGKRLLCRPSDWGPHGDTDRVADISPGLMAALGISTDDEVEVTFPYTERVSAMPYAKLAISSGHGLKVRGAHGIIDEVDEARRVVDRLATELAKRGVEVETFHDDLSTTQNENLNRIVDWHNDQDRDLDISVHFNAFEQVEKPMGTEVLYVTQDTLASQLSSVIADAGNFINRGAKKRTDLFFLNSTDEPAVLLEVCFVDSEADCELYEENFDDIVEALASFFGGEEEGVEAPPPTTPAPIPRIDIEASGNVIIYVNGQKVT